jgi:serine/threonine protein kinase
MGEVYRARDVRLDRIVALKCCTGRRPATPGCADASSTRRARSPSWRIPNICALFDIGEHEGVDFLVMEYLEGETLAARLEEGPLPFDAVSGTRSRSATRSTARIGRASCTATSSRRTSC